MTDKATDISNFEIAELFFNILPDLTVEELSVLGINIVPRPSTENAFTFIYGGVLEYVR